VNCNDCLFSVMISYHRIQVVPVSGQASQRRRVKRFQGEQKVGGWGTVCK